MGRGCTTYGTWWAVAHAAGVKARNTARGGVGAPLILHAGHGCTVCLSRKKVIGLKVNSDHTCTCASTLQCVFLVLVIGLPSQDNRIDCIDQPCALHIACAADLDAALGWELLVRIVQQCGTPLPLPFIVRVDRRVGRVAAVDKILCRHSELWTGWLQTS